MIREVCDIDQENLWVYAPQHRLFDLIDGYDTGSEGSIIGRVYIREIDSSVKFSPWRFRPMEGGDGELHSALFYRRLDELLMMPLRGTQRVSLLPKARVNWNGWEVGLHLGNTPEAERWSGSREAFRSVGLEEGIWYAVDKWIVSEKVLCLKGVVGCYYAGLFEAE